MKTLLFFFFSLFLPTGFLFGQSIATKVLDAKTQQPLAFVNIGVLNKDIGTVSDEKGAFNLNLDKVADNDSLKFSMIGYQSKVFLVKDLQVELRNGRNSILMQPVAFDLQQVIVKAPANLKTKILGNKAKSPSLSGGFSTNSLGAEMLVKIKIKKSPTYLENFTFAIAKTEYDSLFFRLNIYDVKNGRPHQRILNENIYIVTTQKEGVLTTDLTNYNIVMEDDFFIGLEWIKDLGQPEDVGLLMCVGVFNGGFYFRKTSQGVWQKVGIGGPGFNVKVSY